MLCFAVKTLHISMHDAIWGTSLAQLMLLFRQSMFEKNENMITLQDKEQIDKWPSTR